MKYLANFLTIQKCPETLVNTGIGEHLLHGYQHHFFSIINIKITANPRAMRVSEVFKAPLLHQNIYFLFSTKSLIAKYFRSNRTPNIGIFYSHTTYRFLPSENRLETCLGGIYEASGGQKPPFVCTSQNLNKPVNLTPVRYNGGQVYIRNVDL